MSSTCSWPDRPAELRRRVLEDDVEAALDWLSGQVLAVAGVLALAGAQGEGGVAEARVRLLVDDLSAAEALAWGRVLHELGRDDEADEVFAAAWLATGGLAGVGQPGLAGRAAEPAWDANRPPC